MKKQYYFIALIMMLGLFTSVSSASSLAQFWANGDGPGIDASDDTPFLVTSSHPKYINIDYALGTNWTKISAKLWLKAVDDDFTRHIPHCSGNSCIDSTRSRLGQDPSEKALITNIEGHSAPYHGFFGSATEIDGYAWYDLGLDVSAFLSGGNNQFNALLKTNNNSDFWYKNARLDITYDDIKAVPLPAAIWLFGSALLGLTGLKRKSPPRSET